MIIKTFVLFFLISIYTLLAADQPQWGEKHSRNMISSDKNIPEICDPVTGENLKWKVKLGSQTYSTPVVANGKVFIGTNNDGPRDANFQGDRGVLYCFDEANGSLVWQLVVPKITTSKYWDWPREGICSPATIEGDNVYIVSNRGEIMCLDINGLANGNDGPFKDEAQHSAVPGAAVLPLNNIDADIIWIFDLIGELNVRQHDGAHGSPLIDGDYLYVNTSNGVDDTHSEIHSPDAPSLVVVNKYTGKLVAADNERIGDKIMHSTWSSPAMGFVNNKKQIYFGGGDGILYAFAPASLSRENLTKLWWYDGDPTAPKDSVHKYMRNREISPSNIKSMPVFYNNKVYLTLGGDIWWGKRKSWIKCINASGVGNQTGKGELWSFEMNGHCCATPSIYNGLVFVGDTNGNFYCLDAESGQLYWSHELKGDIWASALSVENKVYIGTRRNEFYVFKTEKEKQLIHSAKFDSKINASPVVANGVLYVATMEYLYAFSK